MVPTPDNGIDFTEIAYDSMYDVVDDTAFREKDAELIYEALAKRLKMIPFGNYLKRYIYKRAGLSGKYDEIPIKDYQVIIRDSFADNHTPASFTPSSSKLSALSKNWLTQKTVKRNVVFLLAFGLNMSVDDVNAFLTKALREPKINFKDPFEIICWYCYKSGYNYLKYEKLWQAYLDIPAGTINPGVAYADGTIGFRSSAQAIQDDLTLLSHLAKLKTSDNVSHISTTARKNFNSLYDQTRDIVANIYNNIEDDDNLLSVEAYRQQLSNNDRLFDSEKLKRIQAKRSERRVFTRDDISPSDIEHIICSAVPVDKHGNLVPGKMSKLNEHFNGKRFSRQRTNDILQTNAEVERFDLITLNFFIFSQKLDDYPNNKARFIHFEDSTNKILDECGMGGLYISNPYECFVMMCVLADDPLGTYADVCEISYETET